jgi:hypothetical protein
MLIDKDNTSEQLMVSAQFGESHQRLLGLSTSLQMVKKRLQSCSHQAGGVLHVIGTMFLKFLRLSCGHPQVLLQEQLCHGFTVFI